MTEFQGETMQIYLRKNLGEISGLTFDGIVKRSPGNLF